MADEIENLLCDHHHFATHRNIATLRKRKMKITSLTFIAFYINSAIDTGRYDDIEIHEVKQQITSGSIFDFLQNLLRNDIDLSILTKEDEMELLAEWQDFLAAINERRKMGVERRGLPLLIAYLLEGIQRRLR